MAQITLEGISIDYGSHLCSFYETDAGRLKLALPFLLGGLQGGDRCFLVATPEVQSIILQELRDTRPGIDQDIDDGCLVVTDGLSDDEALYQFFEESFLTPILHQYIEFQPATHMFIDLLGIPETGAILGLKASKQGIQGLRVLGDMAWILQKEMSVEALNDFEARYNQGLGHRFVSIRC